MQELIPINESEFAVYDHETKEYLPKIFNTRELQMLILEELQDYTTKVKIVNNYFNLSIPQHLNNRTNKTQITKI